MKNLVIIPTYNERENIAPLVSDIRRHLPSVDILVVDDNSPDKTQDVVREIQTRDPHVHLLARRGKEGLGKAYIAGFKWGLENGFEGLCEMDADFSHRPEDLVKILAALEGHDFVVGSRWIRGGATANWSLSRKIISRGGSFYARQILRYPLRDWTGGFNAWKAGTLRKIDLDLVKSEGYSFQIELKYRALRNGLNGVEIPILFEDRRAGQSKMSSGIVIEALRRVWSMRALDIVSR